MPTPQTKRQLYILGAYGVAMGVLYYFYNRESTRSDAVFNEHIKQMQEDTARMKESNDHLENTVIPDLDRRIETGKFWLQVTEPPPDE